MKLVEFKEYHKNPSEEGGNEHSDHGAHGSSGDHSGFHGAQKVECNQQ